MKRPPNYIVFKQALRYLKDSERVRLEKELGSLDIRRKAFLNKLVKHFEIEKFRTNPLIWQDIWLYNYIKYEAVDKLKRSGLIAKYEREAFIEDDQEFFSKQSILNSKTIIKQNNKNGNKN